MKRKDFLKSCLVLGAIPFMPNMLKTKEELLSGVHGAGFHQKNGVVQGFWHEDNGELEVVILDYQRILYDKKVLGTKLPHWGKPTDSLKKRKGYFANDKLYWKLNQMQIRCLKEKQVPETTEEAMAQQKIWSGRLRKWGKWISNRGNK